MATVTGWTAAKIAAELATKVSSVDLAESVRDTMGIALVGGTDITITPDDNANTITIDFTGSGVNAEDVEDIVGALVEDSWNVRWLYDDANGKLYLYLADHQTTANWMWGQATYPSPTQGIVAFNNATASASTALVVSFQDLESVVRAAMWSKFNTDDILMIAERGAPTSGDTARWLRLRLTTITAPSGSYYYANYTVEDSSANPIRDGYELVFTWYPSVAGGGAGVTDHGALTGLADDDHTQYHNDARGDARYYTKAQTDSAIDADIATHHGPTSTDHDDRYYTEAEMDSALAGKADTAHGSHPSNINDLGDVTITGPSVGQVIKWNGSAWINDTDATGGGGGALNDITDVTLTSPTNGQVLKYNGSAWINDTDATGGAGSQGSPLDTLWVYKNTTSDADPGAGAFRLNNASPGSATFVYIDDLTDAGTDISGISLRVASGDVFYVQQQNDAGRWVRYSVSGAPTDAAGYWKVPVTVQASSGTAFQNNQPCLFLWNIAAISGPSGGVTDHGALTGLADDDHTQYHNDARGDARYYTKAQTDSAIDADVATHASSAAHDGRYYTESETDSLLAGKANTSHGSHPTNVNDLGDVTVSSPTNGQVLKYNGSAWVNGTDVSGGGLDLQLIGKWNYDQTNFPVPGAGEICFNGTPASNTGFFAHNTDEDAVNRTEMWARLKANDILMVTKDGDPTVWARYDVTSVTESTYVTVAVTVVDTAGTFTAGDNLQIQLIPNTAGAGGGLPSGGSGNWVLAKNSSTDGDASFRPEGGNFTPIYTSYLMPVATGEQGVEIPNGHVWGALVWVVKDTYVKQVAIKSHAHTNSGGNLKFRIYTYPSSYGLWNTYVANSAITIPVSAGSISDSGIVYSQPELSTGNRAYLEKGKLYIFGVKWEGSGSYWMKFGDQNPISGYSTGFYALPAYGGFHGTGYTSADSWPGADTLASSNPVLPIIRWTTSGV